MGHTKHQRIGRIGIKLTFRSSLDIIPRFELDLGFPEEEQELDSKTTRIGGCPAVCVFVIRRFHLDSGKPIQVQEHRFSFFVSRHSDMTDMRIFCGEILLTHNVGSVIFSTIGEVSAGRTTRGNFA